MAWGSGEYKSNYKKRDALLAEALKAAQAGNAQRAQEKVFKAADYGYVPSNHPKLLAINEAIRKTNPAGWLRAKAVKITRNRTGQATSVKIRT